MPKDTVEKIDIPKVEDFSIPEQKEFLAPRKGRKRVNYSEQEESSDSPSAKKKSTARKGKVSKNLKRIDFNQKKTTRGLREEIRVHFKTLMNNAQREIYLKDGRKFYNWLRDYLFNDLEISPSEESFMKIFAGVTYLVFGPKFDKILGGDFSREEVSAIKDEK